MAHIFVQSVILSAVIFDVLRTKCLRKCEHQNHPLTNQEGLMQFTNWSGPCVLVCVSVLWSVNRRHGDFLINCLNFSFVSTWHHYQFIFGYHPFLGQFTNVQALSAFVRPENIFLQQISYFLNSVFCFCWPRKYISSTDFIFLEVLCFCW